MIVLPVPPNFGDGVASDDDADFAVIIEDPRWDQAVGDKDNAAEALARSCYAGVQKVLPVEQAEKLNGSLCVLCTDDAAVRTLNARYRQRDKATNVLSFPGTPSRGHAGDIALGYETCAREAAERALPIGHHFAHLIIHGLLHLCGYDHIDAIDAVQMETLEIEILETLSIANPYADSEPMGVSERGGE
ncbi:MAG: rRNA maturation RNase YbeY [Pseudomonadota bacterium]